MNIVSNMNIGEDQLEDIDDMGEEDDLLLNGHIDNKENQHNHFGPNQHEDQQNHFDANQDDDQENPNINNDNKDSVDNNVKENQAVHDNNHLIPRDSSSSDSS